MKKTFYNKEVVRGLEVWEEMRERRINGEISDIEYAVGTILLFTNI